MLPYEFRILADSAAEDNCSADPRAAKREPTALRRGRQTCPSPILLVGLSHTVPSERGCPVILPTRRADQISYSAGSSLHRSACPPRALATESRMDLHLPIEFPSSTPRAVSAPSYCRSTSLLEPPSRSSRFRDAAIRRCMQWVSCRRDGHNVPPSNDERYREIRSAESDACPPGPEEEHIARRALESFDETPYQKRHRGERSAIFAVEVQGPLLNFCCAREPVFS